MSRTCERCGASPAEQVASSWHLGLILYGKTTRFDGVLCRAHARSKIGGDLARTLVLGWWGVLSFFINLGIVATQISRLSQAAKIAPSQEGPAMSAGNS